MWSDHATQTCDGSDCRSLSHWRGRFDSALTLPAVSTGASASRLRPVSRDVRVRTARRSRTGRVGELCETTTILHFSARREDWGRWFDAGRTFVSDCAHSRYIWPNHNETPRSARARRSAGRRVKRTVAANETSLGRFSHYAQRQPGSRAPIASFVALPGPRLGLTH